MEASPAIMNEAEQHGKLTTCEAELQQPDAQRSLGDGRAQGMMHVVTQHMPHAVRASAGVTYDPAGHLKLVPARPGAFIFGSCVIRISRELNQHRPQAKVCSGVLSPASNHVRPFLQGMNAADPAPQTHAGARC